MYCKNCGETMNDNQAVCIKCGTKAGSGDKFCHNCGNSLPEGADVCLNCGVAVKKKYNGYDKIVIALICFFLGELGVHNFMMGENKKGILKIVLCVASVITCGATTLIVEVFKWIELIRILMDKYVIDPEKLI